MFTKYLYSVTLPVMINFLFTDAQNVQKQAMKAAYDELVKVRDAFLIGVKKDAELVAWTPSVDINPGGDPRAEAVAIYGDFIFPNNTAADATDKDEERGHPNVVTKCCGVIGASVATIELAVKFNKAKDNFDAALKKMRGTMATFETSPGITRQMAFDRAALKAYGILRFSERQACRKIVITNKCPVKIIFMWGTAPSTKKITVAEARAELRDRPQSHDVKRDLDKLDGIKNEDEPLVHVKQLAPRFLAKIGMYEPPKNRVVKGYKKVLKDMLLTYKIKSASMPILVPMAEGQNLPEITPPRGYGDADNAKKKNIKPKKQTSPNDKRVKLEAEPFLKTMNVYRYHKGLRATIIDSEEWKKRLEQ
ncbi:MAG: hypothetical protein ACYC9J_06920 [Sulfuricaulis sp.]